LARPPFRLERALGSAELQRSFIGDPLAAGTRDVLGVSALVAALLGLLGLVLAARSALVSERLQLAEYEALGIPPASLRRSAQIRLVALAALGIAAAVIGAVLSVRLTGSLVAITGTATRPLPPILVVVPWLALVAVVAAVAVAGAGIAALLAGRALREPASRRLRA